MSLKYTGADLKAVRKRRIFLTLQCKKHTPSRPREDAVFKKRIPTRRLGISFWGLIWCQVVSGRYCRYQIINCIILQLLHCTSKVQSILFEQHIVQKNNFSRVFMNMLIDFRNLKLFFPSSNECPELNCSFRFFQCRYTVIEAPDGEFGRLLQNGSWSGMVGQLERRVV